MSAAVVSVSSSALSTVVVDCAAAPKMEMVAMAAMDNNGACILKCRGRERTFYVLQIQIGPKMS